MDDHVGADNQRLQVADTVQHGCLLSGMRDLERFRDGLQMLPVDLSAALGDDRKPGKKGAANGRFEAPGVVV